MFLVQTHLHKTRVHMFAFHLFSLSHLFSLPLFANVNKLLFLHTHQGPVHHCRRSRCLHGTWTKVPSPTRAPFDRTLALAHALAPPARWWLNRSCPMCTSPFCDCCATGSVFVRMISTTIPKLAVSWWNFSIVSPCWATITGGLWRKFDH